MLIVVYQTNTGHRTSSLSVNPMRRTNLHSNVEVVMHSTLCTNFKVFAHFALKSSPRKCYFWCLANIFLKSLTNIFCFLPSFFIWNILKHLRFLCCERYTARHQTEFVTFPGVQSHISGFRYSLKKSVLCVKLFLLKNFALSLNEAPKVHYFCFLLLIQHSAVLEKFCCTKTLQNTQSFFYCITRVVLAIAMFITSK